MDLNYPNALAAAAAAAAADVDDVNDLTAFVLSVPLKNPENDFRMTVIWIKEFNPEREMKKWLSRVRAIRVPAEIENRSEARTRPFEANRLESLT